MEWNQMQHFLVVAQEENISKAAEILHTSQPSLSQTIKRMEEELGYPLFDRAGKRVVLNESGRAWKQTIQCMRELYEHTRLEQEERNGGRHSEVSIYIGCASMHLPALLQYLRKRNPGIHYQIHQWNVGEESRDNHIQLLAESQGHRAEDEIRLSKQEGENCHILLEEKILLAVPSGHPLLEKEEITLGDLRREEFICLNESWAFSRLITHELNRLQFTPKVTMWVDNPNLMRELLRKHMGIAFVPGVTWRAFAENEVLMRPVAGWDVKRAVYLRTPEKSFLTREQKDCIEGMREFFARIKV